MRELLPSSTELVLPLVHAGVARPMAPSLALAGRADLWWQPESMLPQTAAGGPTDALTPAMRARLSAARPEVCGLTMDRPRLMGILNVTPDSFSDGGRHFALTEAVARAHVMAAEVAFIDIGGESTRPGAAEVPVEEEIRRVAPAIRAIRAEGIRTPISVDTRKAAVAEAALDAGADFVNDVTALRFDPRMAALVAERQVPVCLMHSIADPATMQAQARYSDVTRDVYDHLAERIDAAVAAGIDPARIVLDPGIGFGKTTAHNLQLLRDMAAFHGFGMPVLLGVSRKRFVGELTQTDQADQRMPGSVALALMGAAAGMQILRIHDTKETRQALSMWQAVVGPTKDDSHVA